MRRALRLAAAGLLGLVLLLALAFGLAQTGPGKSWIVAALGRVLSDPEERVTITGLSGLVPFDLRIAHVVIADAAGPHLTIDDAALAVTPRDLLRRVLTLRLSARAVTLLRPSQSSSSIDLSPLLHPPLAIALDRLQVARLSLGPDFLGQPVAASVDASGSLVDGRLAADLDLERVDGTPGSAKLHALLAGATPRFELAADIAEPTGRLLADLVHAPEPLPFALHLAGAGPLADWRGGLTASAGASARIDADVVLSGDAPYRLTASGKAALAPLLPSNLRPVLGAPASFSAAIGLAGKRIALETLDLAFPAVTLKASGSLDQASNAIAASATVTLPDLAAFAPLLGGASRGAATAQLDIGGRLDGASARVTLAGQDLGLDADRIAAAHATIDLGAKGDLLAASTPIEISASGDVDGVALAAARLPAGLGDRIDWRLAASADRAGERLALSDLALVDAGNTLTAAASASPAGAEGTLHLVVPDLAPLAANAAQGALALDADVHAGADGSAVAVLQGAIHQPKSGTAMVDALLGPDATMTGTIERSADGRLTAHDLAVTAAAITLAGEGSRSADGRIAATYRLDLPRLAALGPDYAGSAHLTGTAGGPAGALAASAELTADGLRAQEAHLDHVEAKLDLADLAHPSGTLTAHFRSAGLEGSAALAGALSPQALRLTKVHLEAARTQLDGALALRLADKMVEGTLTGSAPDLEPWSALAGMPLSGKVALKASLGASQGQTVDLSLDGSGLGLGASASAQHLHAAARLADLLAKPAGRAELQLDGVKLADASVDQLHLAADTDRAGHFTLTGAAKGAMGEPFTLETGAIATIERGAVELRVTRFAGKLGDQSVQLHQALLLTRKGEEVAFAGLDLGLGSGRLTGDGSLKGEALALHVLARDLPLHDLAQLGGQSGVTGTLGAEATISGTRAKPEGRLVIDGEELRLAAANRPDLPPLGLVCSALWQDGKVDFRGRLAGPHNVALGFTGALPFALAPQSLAPRLPPEGAIALHVEGDGELGNLADLLPSGENRLSGHFTIDVSIGGTVEAPAASGRLSVRNGRFESLVAGTVLSGVSFDLVGNRDRLVLQNFAAGDGAQGSLGLSGSVNLVTADGPAFEVNGQLKTFRAAQTDQATGTVSGDVSLSGNIAAPRLGAQLRIDQAQINVPDRLPQSVRPIPVVVIDSRTGQVLSRPDQQQQIASLLAVALDVTIDMPGQVFVRGRGLDSEWRGRLTTTGTTAQPRITGKLEVVRGTYDFLGKTASLNSGTITFSGGQRIDPDVNIEAQVASTDVTAIVRITGTATQPTIKLTSQPELPQDEILARVLFGTSISQISATQGLQIAQAAASLATGGGPGVIEKIRKGLGLDRLSLGGGGQATPFSTINVPGLAQPPGVPNTFATTGIGSSPTPLGTAAGSATAAAVSAGKYVTEGVYVGVTQGMTASSSSVDVTIDVTRHITIDTTAGQTSGTGVGVNWKLDY